MSEPLSKWKCDVCGGFIESADDGYVLWKSDANHRSYGFKIIHQGKCDNHSYPLSAALSDFLGPRGLTTLLAMLSLGPVAKNLSRPTHCDVADLDEFVDFVRRVQIPYYEEARPCFNNLDLLRAYSGANEICPYLPEELAGIPDRYV